MNQRKSLKELNLLDKFLFDEAMDDPENVKDVYKRQDQVQRTDRTWIQRRKCIYKTV